ncbi:hypothetical protein F511_09661 [Dorcoceras hygrometricum]|uniref:Uncharacterized protein n=1 Tax=Dorcoceras hygrometricum TaxID=472368 RepID=A0A2Z7ANI3_9LAMI|nr:hypothetical protein F511_09661 [Dorcoceras hygrometricum]
MSIDSRMLSMDSKVKSVDSRLGRAFYDKIDTVAGNVKSSLTSLEIIVLHHLTEHQLQLASDLDFFKLQRAELVDTSRRLVMPKRGKVAKVVVDRGKDLEGKEKVQGVQEEKDQVRAIEGVTRNEIHKRDQSDKSDKIWTKLTTLDKETRSEQSQAGQGKTSSENSGQTIWVLGYADTSSKMLNQIRAAYL